MDARHKDLIQKIKFESGLKQVDDKVGKNSSDILSYESRLKQEEDTLDDLERYDGKQNYLVFQLMYE